MLVQSTCCVLTVALVGLLSHCSDLFLAAHCSSINPESGSQPLLFSSFTSISTSFIFLLVSQIRLLGMN